MSRADLSDPAIQDAITDLKNNSSPTKWILIGYVPKSDSKMKVVDTGSGGLAEVLDQVNDGRVLFAFVSFDINNTRKFVYIAWCGEGVVGMKKGLFNNHANDVGFIFKGFHLQINARSEDDLNEQLIISKLQKASGASYDSGAKIQGQTDKNVPMSVAQGRTAATRSNAESKVADKSDYKKGNESQQFWTQTREQEAQDKQQQQQRAVRPKDSTDYNKSSEREQFWAQQKQEQAPTSNPNTNRPTPTPGSNVRSRFEGGNQQQQQQTSAPPPNRPTPGRLNNTNTNVAKPPPARIPEPTPPPPVVEPEPEPVVEETQSYQQEEQPPAELPPPAQEEYYEEPQQEEQTYTEEPVQEQQQYDEYQQQPVEDQQQSYDQQSYDQQPQEESYDQQGGYQEQSGPTSAQAKALYDYDAENPDDLSFKEGDIINVVDSSDPSGWWEGEINGVSGFFPSNFCELIQ